MEGDRILAKDAAAHNLAELVGHSFVAGPAAHSLVAEAVAHSPVAEAAAHSLVAKAAVRSLVEVAVRNSAVEAVDHIRVVVVAVGDTVDDRSQ